MYVALSPSPDITYQCICPADCQRLPRERRVRCLNYYRFPMICTPCHGLQKRMSYPYDDRMQRLVTPSAYYL